MTRRPAMIAAAAGLAIAGLSGCVERRYTIRTNVPGALVHVNGEEIGPSPASKTFYFYGDREIRLEAPGYETMTIIEPIPAPWYDNLLTEFFTENLLPYTIRDERQFSYNMVPAGVPNPADLVNRGQELRNRAAAPPPPRRRGLLGFFGF